MENTGEQGARKANSEVMSDISYAVDAAVGHFRKLQAPALEDDMRQEAWRWGIEALQTYDETKSNNRRGYVYCAIRRMLGEYVSRQLAVVSIDDKLREARNYQNHDSEKAEQAIAVQVDPSGTPEDDVLEGEETRRHFWWRSDVRRQVFSATRRLSEQERHIVERLWGLDGCPAERPRQIAARCGVPVQKVYYLQERFKQAVGASGELWKLYKDMR